ncbi:hypothetical protein VTN31DRAFT_1856 [Thermomyces dupontii]|uniref:uncharacterized protein n=1 Tax=Talaromyces thermophilus TaxID=28565 RepID=UPI00374427D4
MPAEFDETIRAQALTLAEFTSMSHLEISEITGISKSRISRIVKAEKERGFHPKSTDKRAIVRDYVADKPRSGRPKTVTADVEQRILDTVRKDCAGREKSCEYLASEADISRSSAHRVLKRNGFNSVKSTRKPGLSKDAKRARLEFCKRHQHWTLEDWKNVIWSDETSVILGHCRGSQGLWRTAPEANDPTCIRQRWKGYGDVYFGAVSHI